MPEAYLAGSKTAEQPIEEMPRVLAILRQATGSSMAIARPISIGGWLAMLSQARPIA